MSTSTELAEYLAAQSAELKSKPIFIVSIIFLVFTWLAFSLRAYVRIFLIKSFGADDWNLVIALALYSGFCIALAMIANLEMTADLTTNAAAYSEISTLVVSAFGLYILTTIFFKISLAILFLRLVRRKWQRWVIYVCVSVYTVVATTFLCICIFQCGSPGDYLEAQEEGKCLSYYTVIGPLNYLHSTLNAITDWTFAILPMIVVHTSLMSKKTRNSVVGVLALGVIGSICSIARIAYINLQAEGFGVTLLKRAPRFAILSVVEVGVGISCISFITLRPLFNKYLGGSSSAEDETATHHPRTSTNPYGASVSMHTSNICRNSRHGATMSTKNLTLPDDTDIEMAKTGPIAVTTVCQVTSEPDLRR